MTTAVSTLVVGGLVAGALIGSSSSSPAMALAPIGHWVFNGGQAAALHVDPGTGRVDAAVAVPEARDVSMVVQGPEAAYVVSPTKVTVFGKSTLSVDSSHELTDVAGLPTPIETVGGPYLVYRTSGVVVRLGVPPASIQSGGALTRPTYTDEGVVWIERADSGDVCSIAAQQDSTSCAAKVDPSRPHALTVVDGIAGVVDLAGGMFTPISGGSARSIGMPLPLDAKVADRTTSDGMLPVVLPSGAPELLLLPVGANAARGVTKTPLPPGSYDEPLATDTSATVVDARSGTLRSFGSDGARRGEQASPAAVGGLLHRGADGDAYLDGQGGSKAFIVRGATGEISAVDTTVAAAKDAAGVAPDPSVLAVGAGADARTGSALGPPAGPPAGGGLGSGSGGGGGAARSDGPDDVSAPESASGGDSGTTSPPANSESTTETGTGTGGDQAMTVSDVTATPILGMSEGGEVSATVSWSGSPGGVYDVLVDGAVKKAAVTDKKTRLTFYSACDSYKITVKVAGGEGSASTTFGKQLECKPRGLKISASRAGDGEYDVKAFVDDSSIAPAADMQCVVKVGGLQIGNADCDLISSKPLAFKTPDPGETYTATLTATNKYGSTSATTTFTVPPKQAVEDQPAAGGAAGAEDEGAAGTTTTTKPTPTTTTKKKPASNNNGG